jgi:hypothetical protein
MKINIIDNFHCDILIVSLFNSEISLHGLFNLFYEKLDGMYSNQNTIIRHTIW